MSVNEIRQLLNEVEPDPSEAPSASAILSMLPSSNPVDDWDVSSEFKSDALTHTPLTSGSFTASGMRAAADAPLTSQSPKNGFPPDRTKIRLPRYGPDPPRPQLTCKPVTLRPGQPNVMTSPALATQPHSWQAIAPAPLYMLENMKQSVTSVPLQVRTNSAQMAAATAVRLPITSPHLLEYSGGTPTAPTLRPIRPAPPQKPSPDMSSFPPPTPTIPRTGIPPVSLTSQHAPATSQAPAETVTSAASEVKVKKEENMILKSLLDQKEEDEDMDETSHGKTSQLAPTFASFLLLSIFRRLKNVSGV